MMNKLLLSWFISQKGGTKNAFQWGDVYDLLNNIRLFGGCLTINKLDDEGYLMSEIQVRMDEGFYLVTYLNEDDEVMTFSDLTQPDRKMLILGDYWPTSQLTKDFQLVVRVFKEFFDTGNVSTDLLN